MPSAGTPRGRKAPPCPATPSKSKSVHETVTYPIIEVTVANNPCLDKSLSLEHVLACGHLILSAEPNEPCAPNCHHASVTGAQCVVGTKNRNIESTPATGQPFYCDACVETRFEALIPAGATAKQAGTWRRNLLSLSQTKPIVSAPVRFSLNVKAHTGDQIEKLRTEMRIMEAKRLGKDVHYRKCYIGIKLTTVPCQKDGKPNTKYTSRKEHHAFDISIPQVGNNFFQDMLGNEDDASPEDVKLTGTCKRKRATETVTPQRKRRKFVVDDEDFEEC